MARHCNHIQFTFSPPRKSSKGFLQGLLEYFLKQSKCKVNKEKSHLDIPIAKDVTNNLLNKARL